MTITKKDLIPFVIVIGYALFFYCFQVFLYKVSDVNTYPTNENIFKWDVTWYRSIVDNGYAYDSKSACNSGFYFLMPLVWKILHVGTIGMAIANVLFFAIGFSIVCKICKIPVTNQLVWLSIPSMFYIFLPYAEAIFFLLVSLCFIGIQSRKYWLVFISLFLVSLTRASAMFLIPAFLAMELLSNEREKWMTSLKNAFLIYIVPLVLGTAFFILYQHHETGVWFAYFIKQSTGWGHVLSMPILPYLSEGGPRLAWLNAFALFIDLCAFIFIVIHFCRWIFKNNKSNKLNVLSFGYLFAASLMITFMNPSWGGATNDWGLHRYTFATPFFLIFFNYVNEKSFLKFKHFLFAFFIANISFLMFGSYKHIQYFLYLNFVFVMIVFYMLNSNKKLTWPALFLFGVNIFLQIHLFQQFITGLGCD